MEDSDIISRLKRSNREAPRKEWLLGTREILLSKMTQRQAPARRGSIISSFWERLSFPRLILPLSFASIMLVFLGSSVIASRTALPSSPLYPLKLAYESAKGVLAVSHRQQADHSLMIAEERMQELAQLSRNAQERKDDKPKTEIINRTVSRYSDALSQSSRTMKQLKAEGQTELAREAAGKLEKTARAYTALLSTLDTATSSLMFLQNARSVSEEAQFAAEEILASPEDPVNSSSSVGVMASPDITPSLEPSQEHMASPVVSPSSTITVSPSVEPTREPTLPTSPMPNVVE